MSSPLPNARWLRVQSLFSAAIECEPSEREALLARECQEDEDLRREVKSLLAAHESPGLVDQLASEISAPSLWRHCANIMDSRFQHFGVGLATGLKRGQIYWAQAFGAR